MKNRSNMPRKGTRRALGIALTATAIAVVLAINVLVSIVLIRRDSHE